MERTKDLTFAECIAKVLHNISIRNILILIIIEKICADSQVIADYHKYI